MTAAGLADPPVWAPPLLPPADAEPDRLTTLRTAHDRYSRLRDRMYLLGARTESDHILLSVIEPTITFLQDAIDGVPQMLSDDLVMKIARDINADTSPMLRPTSEESS